tara:strand:- start:1713 stop:2462 length:750 start_codon:yes stop_codon:yes gene_type:complete
MSEKEFPLQIPSKYHVSFYQIPIERFFQFGFSVDCVVFGCIDNTLKVMLVERGVQPFKGQWALPGDLVYPNEEISIAAERVLRDLTGIDNIPTMEQTKTYGKVDRHPVGRVLTVGHYALVNPDIYNPHASSWADNIHWVDIEQLPGLAFDHQEIIDDALDALRTDARKKPIGFDLLPEKFTLNDLQIIYESIFNTKLDKGNFRKRMLNMGLLKALEETQANVAHRPARLYSFDTHSYENLKSKDFSFEI